jgi:hypothetical protein
MANIIPIPDLKAVDPDQLLDAYDTLYILETPKYLLALYEAVLTVQRN